MTVRWEIVWDDMGGPMLSQGKSGRGREKRGQRDVGREIDPPWLALKKEEGAMS